MKSATLRCAFVLLLYLQGNYGQQVQGNNQNIGGNNAIGSQQQNVQWKPNNMNQIPNGGLNSNMAQQPNLQQANLQQSSNLSGSKQGNSQQSPNLPPNLQSQSGPVSQNNLQITKIGFTPVSSATTSNSYAPTVQFQNTGVKPNVQVIQPQNIQFSNTPVSQTSNTPISVTTLAELLSLKDQSLLSLLNLQNNGQSQNQQIVSNTMSGQNQLTDAQKQYLVRSLQAQNSGQNQQGMMVQNQPMVINVDNQQAFRAMQGTPQQAQAIITPLGNQPPYITVQAQPLNNYLQNPSSLQNSVPYQIPATFQNPPPQVIVDEEPSILSLILSELSPQYAVDSINPLHKKGSKPNLKSLIPLIINMLKEKNNCGCRNCGCSNNTCQNNECPNNTLPEFQMPSMAEIFGGYSNQKKYGQSTEDSPGTRIKKNDDEESRNNDKEKEKKTPKKTVKVESEEASDEDDSEYIDDGDD